MTKTTAPPAANTTAAHMTQLLRAHYIASTTKPEMWDGGVFAHEVSINGAWGTGERRADALYAGFTSASGRILIGHEIKVSRADWRAELAKADKADLWADACHAWYIVAPSTAVVPPEELPHGWGLMIPPRNRRGKRMQIIVKATVKEDHNPPWWAIRSFMARADTLATKDRSARVAALVEERMTKYESARTEHQQHLEIPSEHRARLRALDEIEKQLGGIEITNWLGYNAPENTITVEELVRGARIARHLAQPTATLRWVERELTHASEAINTITEALPTIRALAGIEDTP